MESRFAALEERQDALLAAINKIDNYKKFCATKLSECDQALSDIDHAMELCSLDAVKMMKVARKRKSVLADRRFYKDEIARAGILLSIMPQSQEIHGQLTQARVKLAEYEKQLQGREYTPRVLFDLFDYDDDEKEEAQQRRKDIQSLGKHATKKALNLEKKFREIKS